MLTTLLICGVENYKFKIKKRKIVVYDNHGPWYF